MWMSGDENLKPQNPVRVVMIFFLLFTDVKITSQSLLLLLLAHAGGEVLLFDHNVTGTPGLSTDLDTPCLRRGTEACVVMTVLPSPWQPFEKLPVSPCLISTWLRCYMLFPSHYHHSINTACTDYNSAGEFASH